MTTARLSVRPTPQPSRFYAPNSATYRAKLACGTLAPKKARTTTPGCRPTGTASPARVLVTRPGHFVGGRQIDPELEAVNGDAFGGDFIVDQTAACGRPLHVAWQDRALMTLIVVMIDAALDDIGHGLDPSVWVLAENTARKPILYQR
jgi:hypothetical protein